MGAPPNISLGGDVVPGQTPGTTPPFVPGDPSAQVNDKTKQILQLITQASQRKQMANTAVPGQIPQGGDIQAARNIGMNTANPHGWGAQRFVATLGAVIKDGVKKTKEDQLLKAEGDWTYLQSSMNELFQAQQAGDPQAIAAAQAKVDVTMRDPKKLKNMAKALNQDWLNPEKTTVYGEALKNVTRKSQQTEQQKAQAAQGIKGIFQKLIQKAQGGQQPQLTPEQTAAMGKEIQEKAPTKLPEINFEALGHVASFERAISAAREKYQYIPSADGTVWAVNKSDPKDAHQLRDADSGDPIKGKSAAKEGQPVMANGLPIGVFHDGKPVLPGDPAWSPSDQKMLDASIGAGQEKQRLRLAPEIAAQIGNPPNPEDFKKGRSDPEYAKALKVWGREAESIKEREAAAGGTARAKAFNEYRPVQVMDDDGNVYYTTAKDAISQKLSGAAEGTKLRPREAQIKDIQVASKQTREAINDLDKPFDTEQIAKLHLALTTPDDSVAKAELTTLATQNLTDKQQDFVVWIKQLNERAMSLRNVAGMGTGAQDLRDAIRDMIPGVRSGSKQMMNKQLDAFDNQVKILSSGIAHPGVKKGALTLDEAKSYLEKAGGDKAKARQLAKADGRTF